MTVSVTQAPQAAIIPRAPQRIGALDWIKGILILFMVAYHAINYSEFRPLAFQYLAFLPPSFILISGFLVAQVYATKYDLRKWEPYLRLGIRGVKLLIIFLALNVAHCMVLERSVSEGLWEFADRSTAIFLSGNGREGIFEVLLPIAYFLLLAPGLLWLRSRFRAAVGVSTLAVCGGCVAMELTGHSSKNLILLSAGFIGATLGLMELRSLDRLARWWPLSLLLYALYRIWSYRFGESYWVQMMGVVLSLLLLYSCASRLDFRSKFAREISIFGRYSLLGYLAQIPLLHVIVRLCGGKPSQWYGVMAVTLIGMVLLLLGVRGVDILRGRQQVFDLSYRTIFS